jgi:SAM-dependent methyltransferase/glycosyltransferase involved in cell wall biosynthesis
MERGKSIMPAQTPSQNPAAAAPASSPDAGYYDQYWQGRLGFQPRDWLDPELARWIAALAQAGRSLLDVGCGDGSRYARELIQAGVELHGVDVSPAAAEAAKKHGVKAVCASLSERLPFDSGSFDDAICLEVLQHLFDPEAAVREIFRVLRPGGRFLVTVPNVVNWKSRLVMLTSGQVRMGGSPLSVPPWRDPHIRWFSSATLRRLVQTVGFEPCGQSGLSTNFLSDVPLVRRVIRLPGMRPINAAAEALGRRFHSLLAGRCLMLGKKPCNACLPMSDLIFISMENWDEIWRRNQFVCAELARRHPEMKILFIGVPRNVWRHAASLDFKTLFHSPVTTVAGFDNITFSRPLRAGLERIGWGVRMNQAITRRHVRQLATKLKMRRPILWLNPHWAVDMVGRMDESAVVYDITDDWISRDQPAWLADQTRRQDAELCRRADAVIVCSQKLEQIKRPLAGDKLHLIPNGVDADHYACVLQQSGPLPPDAAAWPRPVFGYTGTIHTDRLDVDLVEAVARRLQAGSLVFIGPNHLSPILRQRLESTGRVIFRDAVPYQDVPQYMRAFDVSIVPHRISEFVQSLQPIKLWEYLAAGKPIVATAVSGFRDFPELVRLAESADDFCRQLEAALREDGSLSARRQAVARANSWQSRVDAIETVLNGLGHPSALGQSSREEKCPIPART